jgi:hypothetical protein
LIIQNAYRDHIAACTAAISQLQFKINAISLLRLLLFIALCWNIYALAQGFYTPPLLTAFAITGLFIGCVNIYYRWKDKRLLLEKLRFVSTNELNIHYGEANAFPDGVANLDNDNYLDDLDIFGRLSLFHTLNRTTTARGAASLADRLRQPLMQPGEIGRQQDAIRALAGQTEIRRLLTATGILNQ